MPLTMHGQSRHWFSLARFSDCMTVEAFSHGHIKGTSPKVLEKVGKRNSVLFLRR
ncbi:MAG: hypothetical protein RSB88_06175 [Akkermansia sp.]